MRQHHYPLCPGGAGLSTLLENMNEELAQAEAEVEAWKRQA